MDPVRAPFTDLARLRECVLVIPPGGSVCPAAPGDPRIGVEHPGADGPCIVLADIALDLDAFYCRLCQWNGRISGAWATDLIRAVFPKVSPSSEVGGHDGRRRHRLDQ
jgi:hypothetical protein